MIDALTENELPRRFIKPRAIIIHGTGSTVEANILGYYKKSDEKACPHFMVNAQGLVYRIADPETQEAWHCAMHKQEATAYAQGFQHWSQLTSPHHVPLPTADGMTRYADWKAKWTTQGFPSPLGFVTADAPNLHSIGIEIMSLDHDTPTVFNDVQYEGAGLLVKQMCAQFNIPCNARYVLGHSDVNPMARSNSHGGYDPGGRFDWARLFKIANGK